MQVELTTLLLSLLLLAAQNATASEQTMKPGAWRVETRFEGGTPPSKQLAPSTLVACFTEAYLRSKPFTTPRAEVVAGETLPCSHAEYLVSVTEASWKQVCVLRKNAKELEVFSTVRVQFSETTLRSSGTMKLSLPGGESLETKVIVEGVRVGDCTPSMPRP